MSNSVAPIGENGKNYKEVIVNGTEEEPMNDFDFELHLTTLTTGEKIKEENGKEIKVENPINTIFDMNTFEGGNSCKTVAKVKPDRRRVRREGSVKKETENQQETR